VIAVGVQTWGAEVAALRRYWTAAEDLGYARVTYGDGLGAWTHDGWSMLAALAVTTRRLRIGPAVTYAFSAAAHHPAWLAKRAVAIDHLSEGRLDLRLAVGAEAVGGEAVVAVGAEDRSATAWERFGIAYPPAGERLAVLEESLQIMRALWQAETPVDYRGRFYRLHGARLQPGPIQRGGPPIWIAAMGPRALAVTARQADGWEASYVTPDGFAERWTRLQGELRADDRVPERMRRSVELDVLLAGSRTESDALAEQFCAARGIDRSHPLLETALLGDADAVTARITEYARAGATDLMLGLADFPSTAMLEAFAARILPALAD
jgi:alkanesulfonate monooxygenase SsuD/methylene tetrahydromethanopterin reductase-like flavin-dependent oxidoreductase (luciferase family)